MSLKTQSVTFDVFQDSWRRVGLTMYDWQRETNNALSGQMFRLWKLAGSQLVEIFVVSIDTSGSMPSRQSQ